MTLLSVPVPASESSALKGGAGVDSTGYPSPMKSLLPPTVSVGRRRASFVQLEDRATGLCPHHLATWQSARTGLVPEHEVNKVTNPMATDMPDMHFLNPDELVQAHIIINDSKAHQRSKALEGGCVRGNACKNIFWAPDEVKAAIVTCGGLCPGLNSIIRELTNALWYQYGIRQILGMRGGYGGLNDPVKFEPVPLDPDVVREIHMKGGSVLKAGRGGFDAEHICDNLEKLGVKLLLTVGGDGTQGAAHLLYVEARRRGLEVSIVGVPKSIDNDIVHFDRTFGFESAVAAASDIIRNAWVEATSHHKGVGIVKLMGRDAGFVAMHAALASTLVDLVLIPEVTVTVEDVLAHVDAVLSRQSHMVIAVAEGAGQDFVATGAKDPSGHTIYGDIGVFWRDTINKHLKPVGGRSFYIDPSYVIRSCPATPNDHVFCMRLARDAVHTAMRGYTGVVVGPVNNIMVIMPSKLIAGFRNQVSLKRAMWQMCVQTCRMPSALQGQRS